MNWFMRQASVRKMLTRNDRLAGLIGAAIHDFEHDGLTNVFHVGSRSELATRYNDRAVLENHHIASAYSLMKIDEFNIFETLSTKVYNDVRESIITAVLHTDMKTHFDSLASFNGRVTQAEEGVEDLSVDSADDRRMVLGMVLHCCDVSNMAKPRPIYLCVRRCLRRRRHCPQCTMPRARTDAAQHPLPSEGAGRAWCWKSSTRKATRKRRWV